MKKLGIIGLGLIGSSIARGLAGKYHIVAYDVNAVSLKKAMSDKVINEVAATMKDAAQDADIVMIAAPMGFYDDIMNTIAEHLQPGTIITDVGSVKTPAIFQIYRAIPPGVHYVPGHPVAGKETSGYEAGDGKLFHGKKVILTPLPKTPYEVNLEIENLWKTLGARVEIMTASEHDKIYAAVSHVPQLLSFAYKMALGHKKYGVEVKAEGDYKKFSRISNSSPDIWVDVFQLNRAHIFKFLEKMFGGLQHIEKFSEQIELREKLDGTFKSYKLSGDKKIDAATVIFPALLGNLLLFCIEDEFDNLLVREFKASDLHSSLAMLDEPAVKKQVRNFADYAGSGLKDFTICSSYDVSGDVENYMEEIQLLKALLHRKIFEITVAVESDNDDQLRNKLLET